MGRPGPVSDLVAHTHTIREALTSRPVRTVAEAAEQIEHLTGLKRQPKQVRKFLKAELGFRWRRTRVIPCPPKTDLPNHIGEQKHFLDTQLQPRLDEAVAGVRQVFFVDAAHFVFGTFLCCLWSLTRIFVKAASGRQRFNVLGAWNAVMRASPEKGWNFFMELMNRSFPKLGHSIQLTFDDIDLDSDALPEEPPKPL